MRHKYMSRKRLDAGPADALTLADEDFADRSAPVHTGRLVLTTLDPHAAQGRDLLAEALADLGFIGASLDDSEDIYRVGPCFLSLVTFTGCAVRIEFSPDAGSPFCHVRIPPLAAYPRLYFGRNTRPPRCGGCRGRLLEWREMTAHWASHPHAGVTCPQCGETRPPWLWDWKQQGGFGRLFIEVEEIFPGEATPSHELLDELIRASGAGWRHFYVQD